MSLFVIGFFANDRSKRSKIEKETNFNVVMNFVILILLCVVTAVLRESENCIYEHS